MGWINLFIFAKVFNAAHVSPKQGKLKNPSL